MTTLLRFTIFKQIPPALILFAIVLCIALGFYQNFQSVGPVPPQTGWVLKCDSPLSENHDEFDVYLTDASFTDTLLDTLCHSPVIRRQFGNVKITVGENDYDTFRYINHGVSDLALVKNNVIDAFGANQIYGYEEIAAHRDYSAYFIALKEKPTLSKEYLLGKRIGILDYPSSRSGHIVPKTVLKRLGLNDNNVDLSYYNSHQALRRALLAGDVDMISSYWAKGDDEILSRSYITALENRVSGMRWYLKLQSKNTDLACAVQSIIKRIAQNHPKQYYQDVELTYECKDTQAQ